jgi:D-alanyl-D-alanine carboxypeptidase
MTRVGFRSSLALCAVVLVLTSGVPVARADEVASSRARLQAALEADLDRDPSIPGEALAVEAPGLHVALAVGRADVASGARLRPTTRFRVASVTKTFVAAAVLRLVEQHRIGLAQPIARYLSPQSLAILRAGRYDPERITVRQLLRHTSGLFDYATSDSYDHVNEIDPAHHWTRAEQLQFAVDHGAPVAPPGTTFHYSDTGYVLLGEIIERVTGDSLATAARELLHFRELGLDDTYWEQLEPPPDGNAARAHQYDGAFDNIGLDASHDLYGGGGIVSTVADLATFYRALFRGQVFDEPGTLSLMTRVSRPGHAAGAAMGLFAERISGVRCFDHPGFWGTDTTYCPRLDLAFARTINQADDDGFDYGRLDRVVVDVARDARHAGPLGAP